MLKSHLLYALLNLQVEYCQNFLKYFDIMLDTFEFSRD